MATYTMIGITATAGAEAQSKIANGTTGQVLTATTGAMPAFAAASSPASSCAFSAYLSGTASNVTGDGTAYTVAFDTELLDAGGDFNVGTYTFTAPANGNYQFNISIVIEDAAVGNTNYTIVLYVGGVAHDLFRTGQLTPGTGDIHWTRSGSWFGPMAAAGTAYVVFTVAGATKIIDVVGTNGWSCFSGFRVS